MKYWVKRSCGHEEQVDLYGKTSERENKIKWMESKLCKACYNQGQDADCKEIEMSYREYKEDYNHCKTKPGSYDKKYKTIVVYVPSERPQKSVEEKDEIAIRTEAIEKLAEETGLPKNGLTKTFFFTSAEKFLQMAEQHADKLKAAADKTGRYENAYIAAMELGKAAQKYNL
jgi:hypothetical protein